MKVSFSLKITLLVLCALMFGLGIFSLHTILVIENKNFEYSMLNLFGIVCAGFFSVVYHAKTLSYYKTKLKTIVLEKNIFWIGNIVFALMLIGYSTYILYGLNEYGLNEDINIISNLLTPFLICILTLVLGVFLIAEVGFLYRKSKYLEQYSKIESISDIKGVSEDDDIEFKS